MSSGWRRRSRRPSERDFYLSRVDKAKAVAAQQERKREVRASCSPSLNRNQGGDSSHLRQSHSAAPGVLQSLSAEGELVIHAGSYG